jgi:hypothetical protein
MYSSDSTKDYPKRIIFKENNGVLSSAGLILASDLEEKQI